MTFTIKIHTLPGSPMMSEYECELCGRIEKLVTRDENGDPPETVVCGTDVTEGEDSTELCAEIATLTISAPMIQFWSRPPVPIGYASKSDEKDPRALDTEPLATGKMTKGQWRRWQRDLRIERRYQRRLKAGKISKRIQVGGGT